MEEANMTGRSRVGPASNAPEPVSLTDSGAVDGVGGRRILVVDDDPTIASTLAECLAPAGYEVDVAADGADAVARALLTPPDLVVLDVNLPPTDGFDTAASIRQSPETRAIPILLLS